MNTPTLPAPSFPRKNVTPYLDMGLESPKNPLRDLAALRGEFREKTSAAD